MAKGGFGTTYKATWKDGRIDYWNSKNNQWKRYEDYMEWDSENNQWERDKEYNEGCVALKCLHNSQNITTEFLREVRYFFHNF